MRPFTWVWGGLGPQFDRGNDLFLDDGPRKSVIVAKKFPIVICPLFEHHP